ncbi:unnamed protein product [Musa acuminata subsp. malaccensis]|uniref:(wild Malaysian banana) hypothetical protein n=1 Tax=Musa acuminata subsp. malaccensis TaxID=214687 RepID=A0A804HN32_MUSAM|nr:unnamed protein product [Musa acuminata subsp. malaccensis]
MMMVAVVMAAAMIATTTVAITTTAVATATTTVVAAMAIKAAAKEVGGSYNEKERWGNAGEHSTKDTANEGNGRWRRVAVEKTIAVR